MTRLLMIILVMLFIGCGNEEEAPQPQPVTPKCWEQFLGNYIVFNTDSNNYYNMTITNEKDTSNNGVIYDALIYHNFANKFVLKVGYNCIVDSTGDDSYMNIGAHDTAYDYNGNRWFLFPYYSDSLNNKSTWLNNDTINLSFYMCNIAYYIYDGAPYYCKDVIHIAVKQH